MTHHCQAFTGALDEMRLWTTVRSDEEIAGSYRLGISNYTGVELYWRFDEHSAAVSTDSSGSGRVAQLGKLLFGGGELGMTYTSDKETHTPAAPVRIPSDAPLVGDGPVVVLVVDGANTVTLVSHDAEDEDLDTRRVSHGRVERSGRGLVDGARLGWVGMTPHAWVGMTPHAVHPVLSSAPRGVY